MPFFKKSLAGPGYIVLNTIRVLNIIALVAVVAASFVMLVKTFIVSKFFFFDGVSHVITGFLASKPPHAISFHPSTSLPNSKPRANKPPQQWPS